MSDSERLTITLPEETKEKIEEFAEKEDLSLSAYVKKATQRYMDYWVNRDFESSTREELYDKAFNLLNRGERVASTERSPLFLMGPRLNSEGKPQKYEEEAFNYTWAFLENCHAIEGYEYHQVFQIEKIKKELREMKENNQEKKLEKYRENVEKFREFANEAKGILELWPAKIKPQFYQLVSKSQKKGDLSIEWITTEDLEMDEGGILLGTHSQKIFVNASWKWIMRLKDQEQYSSLDEVMDLLEKLPSEV